jgi:hypothetical protein
LERARRARRHGALPRERKLRGDRLPRDEVDVPAAQDAVPRDDGHAQADGGPRALHRDAWPFYMFIFVVVDSV